MTWLLHKTSYDGLSGRRIGDQELAAVLPLEFLKHEVWRSHGRDDLERKSTAWKAIVPKTYATVEMMQGSGPVRKASVKKQEVLVCAVVGGTILAFQLVAAFHRGQT